MIRPLTLLGGIAFLASGLYVFQTKEEVARLERDLRAVHREVEEQRARTRLLAAEWARLNDQDRLRQLAQTHLRDMQPMEPLQFVRPEDAPRRLPAPQAFAAAGGNAFRTRGDLPTAPGEALVFRGSVAVAEAAPPSTPATAAPRSAGPAAPPPVAEIPAAERPRAAPPPPGPRPVTRTAEPTVPAAAEPPPVPLPEPPPRPRADLAALPPVAGPPAAVARPAAARAEPPRETPARAPALRTAAHVPAPPAPPSAGSLLGGGIALPPPVPVAR